ncbi:MAG: DUF2589 domain-containing protein [Alphaproteobacteria bacterium]|nr:DUF2589 domain-containing protein [Alphaproteobacteria bacterium]
MKPRPISELLAAPLHAAVQAKKSLALETLDIIKSFGIDEDNQIKNLTFTTTRMVEVQQPTKLKDEPSYEAKKTEISVPLLSLINLPNMQLTEMNVEMALHVVVEADKPLTGVLTHSQSRNLPPTIKINMKIVDSVPEGLARINDLLADMLQGINKKQ